MVVGNNMNSSFSSGLVSTKENRSVVRKSTLGMFDSMRSTSSTFLSQSASSSGGEAADDTEFEVDDEMPDDEEIERRFSILLEKMTLPPERAAELFKSPKTHKWKMIKAKEMMQPKYSSGFYIEQLRNHREIGLNKNVSKKSIKGLEPVEKVLRSLEVDLRTHPNTTWLREFIDDPYRGHRALIEFLQFLHIHYEPLSITEERQARKKSKTESIVRDYVEEHLCLLCLRVLMRNKYGFQSIMDVDECLQAIILCLKIDNLKTQALVVKMLTVACLQTEYYDKVVDAINFYTRNTKEAMPFQTLVNLMYRRPISPQFQMLCLTFFNSIINASPTLNKKVFHQQQLENAGFDPERVDRTLEGLEVPTAREALKTWREKHINVQTVMDEFISLRERSTYLRHEVDLLQTKLEDSEKVKSDLARQYRELEQRCEEYRLRVTELQTSLENVVKQVKNEAEAMDIPEELIDSIKVAADAAAPHPVPPPPPPPPPAPFPNGTAVPPPPPQPPDFIDGTLTYPGHGKHRKGNKVRLPLLNWVPICQNGTSSSFFESEDNEILMDALDFKEFDKKFELKVNEISEDIIAKKEQALKTAASQISIIEPKRARNLVIARRRIQHSTSEIAALIEKCDLVELPAEHAELLLKILPTKEELSSLARHASDYHKMGEAEQFMFQMAKVERYEAKLSVMAFIGVFDDLMGTLMPQIDAVLRAATSIINSTKLKKIFQIVLIFGNYMNSSRRGLAYGFKLESLYKLQDTRSSDRQQTFLSYMAEVIQRNFPDLLDFSDELHLDGATSVSMQSLAADVQGLRKGLDLAKTEKDKQPNNFIIYNFYSRAYRKVQRVVERYRKMDEIYTHVCTLFGENPKLRDPSEFFKAFTDFICLFKKATRELELKSRNGVNLKRVTDPGELPPQKRMAGVAEAAAREGQRRSAYLQNHLPSAILT